MRRVVVLVILTNVAAVMIPAASRVRSAHAREIQKSELAEANQLVNDADRLYDIGKYDQALPLLIRALATAEKAVGTDHPMVAIIIDKLALLYLAMKQFSEAEPLLERSLSIREKTFGVDSLEASQSCFNLGDFYQMTGDFGRAVPFYGRAFATRERLLKPGDVRTVTTAFRYSCVLRKTNRQKESETVLLHSQMNRDKQFPQVAPGSTVSNGGIRDGKLLSSPQPAYPKEASQPDVSGRVTVQVLIDEKGTVINACAVDGNPVLWTNAEMAAYGARYSPTTLLGVAIRTPGVLTYDFRK